MQLQTFLIIFFIRLCLITATDLVPQEADSVEFNLQNNC